jgi:hypothetical protein
LIMLQISHLFKIWENIPALQSVSATMSAASTRIIPFLVIMMLLVTVFGGAAMLAFGQQMEEFHDFTTACVSTLIVISKGSSDIYQRQFAIDPFLSSVWHWLLVCVMTMVLLHLIFCILVESYAEAQASVLAQRVMANENIPTLFEQGLDTTKFVVQRMRTRRFGQKKVREVPPLPTLQESGDIVPVQLSPTKGTTRTRVPPSSNNTRDFTLTNSFEITGDV